MALTKKNVLRPSFILQQEKGRRTKVLESIPSQVIIHIGNDRNRRIVPSISLGYYDTIPLEWLT